MSLYNRDSDPIYSYEITNIYHKDKPWNQKKVKNKSSKDNIVTNVFKLIGIFVIASYIFFSMTT